MSRLLRTRDQLYRNFRAMGGPHHDRTASRERVRGLSPGHPTLDALATLWQRPASQGISAPAYQTTRPRALLMARNVSANNTQDGRFAAPLASPKHVCRLRPPGGANCETHP